jgi:hypothetical protein
MESIITLGFSTGSNGSDAACVVFMGFCGQESSDGSNQQFMMMGV